MFDQNTIGLISNAPNFKQIGLKSLSKEFTRVYAEIVTGRAKLQREDASEGTRELINRMKKIALTYEGILAVNSERSNAELKSIAFIAASAHQLVFLAQQTINDSSIDSKLATHMISSDISAALLFAISGYMSDAKNVANLISISSGDSDIKVFLSESIVALIYGNLESILEYNLDDLYIDDSDQLAEQATNALYLMLLQGIQLLAHELLDQNRESSFELFQNTYQLCSEKLGVSNSMSIYAGPRYLASLLKLVTISLTSRATTQINSLWSNSSYSLDHSLLRQLAIDTPYLLDNDLTAIDVGYLNSQISSVIRFPIGMDYFSILSLKIIETLSSTGKTSVFLVEDKYSRDEITKRLKNIFGDNQIKTYKDLHCLRKEIIALVVTTEDLIELLKYPIFTQLNIGLFVIEECAILGNTLSVIDVSIEPMFALLSFLDKFPTTKMLLFTSKVQNIQEVSKWIENITNNSCLPISLGNKPARQAKGIVVYDEEEVEENDAQDVQPQGLFSLEQNWMNQVSEKAYSLVKLSDALVSLSSSRRSSGRLTPNKYAVSTLIAESLAIPDCKVVVFTDNVSNSVSHLTNQTQKNVCLNEEENRLYLQCLDEFGGANELYLQVDDHGYVASSGVCDFNLLLPIERRLYRSLFQRQDGVDLLITNIWSSSFKDLSYNVAVIAGHQQFDLVSGRQISYNKQELLEQIHHIGINSHSSSAGLAIIVPSNVIKIQRNNIPSEIMDIYSSDEYESELYDPLTNILDNLTLHQSIDEVELPLIRLIHSETKDSDYHSLINSIVKKSYVSYKRNNAIREQLQVEQLSARQKEYENFSLDSIFADYLGVNPSLLTDIINELTKFPWYLGEDLIEYHYYLSKVLLENCPELENYFRCLLSTSLSREKDNIPEPSDIISFISLWMKGDSIIDISKNILTPLGVHNQKLLWYRRILCRCIPVYITIIELIKNIYQKYIGKESLSLSLFQDCVKYGFDRYEKLILYKILREEINRREIHRIFDKLDIARDDSPINETYHDAWGRVKSSYQRYEARLY